MSVVIINAPQVPKGQEKAVESRQSPASLVYRTSVCSGLCRASSAILL